MLQGELLTVFHLGFVIEALTSFGVLVFEGRDGAVLADEHAGALYQLAVHVSGSLVDVFLHEVKLQQVFYPEAVTVGAFGT